MVFTVVCFQFVVSFLFSFLFWYSDRPELYDVCIRAEDGTTVQCHKCILAARLEYFHSMLGSGWIEVSYTNSVTYTYTFF